MTNNNPPPMPERIWVHQGRAYVSETQVFSCDKDGSNVVFAKDSPECTEYIRADLARTPAIADGVGVKWNYNMDEAPRDGTVILISGTQQALTARWLKDAWDREGWAPTGSMQNNLNPIAWAYCPSPATPPQAATDEG